MPAQKNPITPQGTRPGGMIQHTDQQDNGKQDAIDSQEVIYHTVACNTQERVQTKWPNSIWTFIYIITKVKGSQIEATQIKDDDTPAGTHLNSKLTVRESTNNLEPEQPVRQNPEPDKPLPFTKRNSK